MPKATTHYCPRCMLGGFADDQAVREHLVKDHKRTVAQAVDLVAAHDTTQPLPTRALDDFDGFGGWPMGFCV